MDESGPTQNRRTRRSHVLMTASLEVGGKVVDVKLRNLSSEGARVEGARLPVEGTELLFRKGDLAADARVVWAEGGQAGIRFAVPLDPVVVLRHIEPPRRRAQPDFRRPGLAARKLTAVERELGEQWVVLAPTVLGD